MSIEGFVKHGYHRGLVLTRDGGEYGRIQLFDIGMDDMVGATYSDGSRQAHPIGWHTYKGVESALAEARAVQTRPRLKPKNGMNGMTPSEEPNEKPPPSQRLRLARKTTRPHLRRRNDDGGNT